MSPLYIQYENIPIRDSPRPPRPRAAPPPAPLRAYHNIVHKLGRSDPPQSRGSFKIKWKTIYIYIYTNQTQQLIGKVDMCFCRTC